MSYPCAVVVAIPTGRVVQAVADDIVERLAALGAVAYSRPDGRLGVELEVDADDADQALALVPAWLDLECGLAVESAALV